MNTFVMEAWDDEGSKCSFYTVRWMSATKSETDKFFEKYRDAPLPYREAAHCLLRLVTHTIGDEYGAIDAFFDRNEHEAQALPPRPKSWLPEVRAIGHSFPLRLFCLRLNKEAVVLFGGGRKESRTIQDSKDLSLKFHEAQAFAKSILGALRSGEIRFEGNKRTLVYFDGEDEMVLQ